MSSTAMRDTRTAEMRKATKAPKAIIPLRIKHEFRSVIAVALRVMGVKRQLADIDIDLHTSKDSLEFRHFLSELESYLTQPFYAHGFPEIGQTEFNASGSLFFQKSRSLRTRRMLIPKRWSDLLDIQGLRSLLGTGSKTKQ